MSLAIVITTTIAHPHRLANASALQQQIDAAWRTLDLPAASYACWLHADDPARGCWPDTAEALDTALSAGFRHVLILQDDVRLHPDFVPAVHNAIAAFPEHVWSGFTRRKSHGMLRYQGYQWASAPILTNGPCVCYPALAAADLLDWCAAHVKSSFPSYDQRVTLWAVARKQPIYYTIPCLVQHDETTFGSVHQSPNPHRRRVAECFDAETPLPDFQATLVATMGVPAPLTDRFGAWQAEAPCP